MRYGNNYFKVLAAILTLNVPFGSAQDQDPSHPMPTDAPTGNVPITAWSPPHYPSRKYPPRTQSSQFPTYSWLRDELRKFCMRYVANGC